MKNQLARRLVVAVLIATVAMVGMACSDDQEQQRRQQIQQVLNNIERDLENVEQHQQTMGLMIQDMQAQLDAMQAEIDRESPRIHSAGMSLAQLRDLTLSEEDDPFAWTLMNPSWSVGWILLFIFVMWLLIRIRHRSYNGSE